MRKTMIMSLAVVTSLFCGEALMATVFAFVMISGLTVGCFMSEAAREVVECPALAFRPSARRLPIPRS